MKILNRSRRTPDPLAAAALAEARAAQTRAEVDRLRALAELRREQEAADQAAARAAAEADDNDRRRRAAARQAEQTARREHRRQVRARLLARLRLLAPLLIVNAAAVGGQVSYAYVEIAPSEWGPAARLALALGFAAAVESVALYVGWHAHDALLQKAHATAARLRRTSYLIAAVVASINYAHFAGDWLAPTAAAVAFGLLSFLSPWLWGLHTRRVQHVQLVREDLVDETGVEFDPARRRAFPFRSWAARRWSIDHNVRDPRQAWEGYNAERRARLAERSAAPPSGRVAAAWAALRGRAVPATEAAADPPDDAVTDPWRYAEPVAPVASGDDDTNTTTDGDTKPAKRTPRKTTRTRQPGRQTAAERVAAAVAKRPDSTQGEIAKRLSVSLRTVQRHWPDSDGVNGNVPDLDSVRS